MVHSGIRNHREALFKRFGGTAMTSDVVLYNGYKKGL
jgi:hypothetical protein